MIYKEIIVQDKIIRGYLHQATGSDSIVVMLHGFTGNKNDHHFMFKDIAKHIHTLGYDVFRFDFLGSGDSDGHFEESSLAFLQIQCEKVIAEFQSNYKQIHLFGFSLGGALGANYCGNHPKTIESLFLMSPAFQFASVLGKMLHQATTLPTGYDLGGLFVTHMFEKEAQQFNFKQGIDAYQGKIGCIIGSKDPFIEVFEIIELESIYKDFHYEVIAGADHCYTSLDYTKQAIQHIDQFYRRT